VASFLSQLIGVRFCLLSPHYTEAAGRFPRAVLDAARHARILAELQRLRGRVYRAIDRVSASALTADGRQTCRFDELCWHLVAEDESGRTISCIRLLRHPGAFDLARSLCGAFLNRMEPALRRQYAAALEALARRMREKGVEVVDASAVVAARNYPNKALGPVVITGVGATLAVCTGRFLAIAPAHHTVSALYRRLGGEPLTLDGHVLPRFDDRVYRGEHEFLLVDYSDTPRQPAGTLDTARELRDLLIRSPVVCREA
jgi:hypothetical protein